MKIVCFGDSITAREEGYPKPMLTTMLEQKLTEHLFINAGVRGDTTVTAVERLENDVLKRNPDLVTILFGANDSAAHKLVRLEDYEENLRFFVKKIGAKKVILISPAPVDEALQPHRSNARIKAYGDTVKKISDEIGCNFIDFFSALYERSNYREILIGIKNDGLHFGEEGYQLLSNMIAKEIRILEKGVAEKY
ncbi:GDSL-type esterase/lipase family protein [Rummeliibacillus pycnus]|uniref:GDSL-type esterase/lipase family protein n=1 Tax=Rummeliibacillus pycnus TaxID=101070 RepID=UPI0037CA8146